MVILFDDRSPKLRINPSIRAPADIAMHHLHYRALFNLIDQQFIKQLELPVGSDGPVGHVLAADMHADTLKALLLAVERQVVDKLAGQDKGQCRG